MDSMFKYIFALIVGVLFIIFFVGFGFKYLGTEEQKIGSLSAANFDDQLSILSVSQDAIQKYDFGTETAISFNQGFIRSGTGDARKSNSIVYSPTNLKGKKILIWTKRWHFPYAITNFFYMTNEKYKYVLIYDDDSKDLVKELADPEEEIPKEFKVVKFDADKLRDEFATFKKSYSGFSHVRFAYFSENPNPNLVKALRGMKNADVIIIAPENDDWSIGKIGFGADDEAIYLGREMLLGAIFADDYTNYYFNLEKKALPKLNQITSIYIAKADFMSQALQCTEYNLMKTALGQFNLLTQEDDPQSFLNQAEALEELNKKQFGAECPGVF